MRVVLIKGHTYTLGDVPGTAENFVSLAKIMECLDSGEMKNIIDAMPSILSMLEQSIAAGSSAAKAKKAVADLPMKFGPESELMTAISELVQSLLE